LRESLASGAASLAVDTAAVVRAWSAVDADAGRLAVEAAGALEAGAPLPGRLADELVAAAARRLRRA
jgi:hypothetical protein